MAWKNGQFGDVKLMMIQNELCVKSSPFLNTFSVYLFIPGNKELSLWYSKWDFNAQKMNPWKVHLERRWTSYI